MRISELARRGDVPVATVKFYLREGLLPTGELTSATQAQYGESHVDRLRLVRALLGSGLSVAAARTVLDRLERDAEVPLDLLGDTHTLLTPAGPDVDLGRATALVRGWGWETGEEHCGPLVQLARALETADAAGFTIPDGLLDLYADAMLQVGSAEIAATPTTSPRDVIRYVVLGTVLMEPVLLALRRLAESHAAIRAGEPTDEGR